MNGRTHSETQIDSVVTLADPCATKGVFAPSLEARLATAALAFTRSPRAFNVFHLFSAVAAAVALLLLLRLPSLGFLCCYNLWCRRYHLVSVLLKKKTSQRENVAVRLARAPRPHLSLRCVSHFFVQKQGLKVGAFGKERIVYHHDYMVHEDLGFCRYLAPEFTPDAKPDEILLEFSVGTRALWACACAVRSPIDLAGLLRVFVYVF